MRFRQSTWDYGAAVIVAFATSAELAFTTDEKYFSQLAMVAEGYANSDVEVPFPKRMLEVP